MTKQLFALSIQVLTLDLAEGKKLQVEIYNGGFEQKPFDYFHAMNTLLK